MSAHRAVLLALLVVGGSLAVVAPASAAADSTADSAEQSDAVESDDAAPTADTAATGDAATASGDSAATDARFAAAQSNESAAQNDSTNSSLGGDISSFMQSSAAEIDGAVETGMWSAEFNATTDRSRQERLVERRTDELRADLNDLQERKQELVAERDAGNISEAAYKAQVGRLLGRINALESAINATEPRARQTGTNVDALEMLESDTRNLTGPEIAAIARNTSGVGNGNGPPEAVGSANGSNGVGNGSDGVGNGNDSNGVGGPPEDVGNGGGPLEGAANGSETDAGGPPEDVGNGSGPPDGVGNGNDAANWTTDSATEPNATTPGAAARNGSDDADSSAVGLNLTTESLGVKPVSDAHRVRTSTVLRALPFA